VIGCMRHNVHHVQLPVGLQASKAMALHVNS
jgi:hypothetical protein